MGFSDKGIQFISPIFIPLPSVCGCCRHEALLEYVVLYQNGRTFAVCLACRNQLISEAGVADSSGNVVVFPHR